ncbi:MAG TPA: sugar phosphate isomerase/epimerase [Phycisphaerae bacterium]|nr:sugar phosphate isomerase/epimerase [Phycisphaerae bacterium]
MITISLCSIAFRDEPIESLVPRIAQIGYDAVEIFGSQIDGKSDEELSALKDLCAEHGLRPLAVAPYLSLTRSREAYDESLACAERFVHYCRVLGAPKFRTFTDVGPKGIGSDVATPQQWAQGIEGLKHITALDRGIAFVMETHPQTLVDTVESIERVLAEVDAPNLKVLYQPGNTDFRQRGIIECWRRLRPHVEHMHIQNHRDDDAPPYVEEGTLDLPAFFRAVKADGYDGSMSVEYCWRDVPWEKVESACAYLAKYLRG